MLRLILLAGSRVTSWRASAALRMRASMSAIGSVSIVSPTRLGYARQLAAQRHQPEAQPAQVEVTIHGFGTSTDVATPDQPGFELGGAAHLRPLTCTRHQSTPEWHTELTEELLGFLIGLGGSDHGYVHALDFVDLVEVNLGKHDLLSQTQRVVARAVEGART